MPYPLTVDVEPLLTNRNRLTTAFRLILFIPHAILVGGVGFGLAYKSGGGDMTSLSGETGVLGTMATMPGLSTRPGYYDIDVDTETGRIIGLS